MPTTKLTENKLCAYCKKLKSISDFLQYKTGKNKGYYFSYCKECNQKNKKIFRNNNPWIKTLNSIKSRCGQLGRPYNVKNIDVNITKEELKIIWFRDRAYEMESPSIDRINPRLGYSYKNCRYVELRINQLEGLKNRWDMVGK